MTEILSPKEVENIAQFMADLLTDERTPEWIKVKIVGLMVKTV
jgi:hypothetical protein